MNRISRKGKAVSFMVSGLLSTLASFAQDAISNTDIEIVTTDINKTPFYAELWFWILIGFVFLLILIALIRGGGKKTKREDLKDEDVEHD